MKLGETWFTESFIDFELQKYRLLAYLKDVQKRFGENKLYPEFTEVISHYNNIISFRDNKKSLQDHFPKHAGHVDLQQLQLVYEQIIADDEIMKELERITSFAADEMKNTLNNGVEIYEFVAHKLIIEPVGILPVYKNEGYMLLHNGNNLEINVYAYSITLFEHATTKYKGLKVQYVDSWQKKINNTNEQIKRDILLANKSLPTPAVYSVVLPLCMPLHETLLPVAKRALVKYISASQ